MLDLLEFLPAEALQENNAGNGGQEKMKFEVFSDLQESAVDFKTALLAFQTARADASDLTAAVEARISAERARDAGRAAELRGIVADAERSATVKRVAQAELDELAARSYAPTNAEREAFDAAISEGEQALKDADALRHKMIDQLRKARAALDELDRETIHKPDGGLDLRRRWLDGEKEAFAMMTRRVCGEAAG